MCFTAIAAVYIAIGILLSFHYGIISGDALSRTADAGFVLQSRDPHLAAMGFVFTPLTTLMQLPLVGAMSFWPTLLAHAVPATIVSSLCMAGSVLQVSGILRDRGAGLGWTYGLGLLYSVHPMIILYGANGMSEGPFLLFCTAACRFLMRWMRSDDVHDLAVVAMALAAAYLVRYDALAAGGFVAVLVAVTTWWRTRGTGERRLWAGATDATVVVVPLVTSFVLWALVSWLLSGDAFAQFSSVYGNTAILKSSGQSDLTSLQRGLFSLGETMALAPLLPVVAVVVSVAAWVRRTPEVLPPFAIFGGILLFQAGSYTSGGTFGFLRFSIVAVPLTVVLVGLLRARRGVLVARRAGPAAKLVGLGSAPTSTLRATRVAAVLVLFPGMLVSWVAMGSTRMAPQEFAVPALVAGGHVALGPARSAATVGQAQALARTFGTERQLATLPGLTRPAGRIGAARHRVRIRGRRGVLASQAVRDPVGLRLRPPAERSERGPRQVPAHRRPGRARCDRRGQPPLSLVVRQRRDGRVARVRGSQRGPRSTDLSLVQGRRLLTGSRSDPKGVSSTNSSRL